MQEIDSNPKPADSMEMTFELKAPRNQPNVITDCAAGTYRKPYQLAKRPEDQYSQPLSAQQVASKNQGWSVGKAATKGKEKEWNRKAGQGGR